VLDKSAPGEAPAGVAAMMVSGSAKVTAVDQAAGTMTVQDAAGKSYGWKVRDPSVLKDVQVARRWTSRWSKPSP